MLCGPAANVVVVSVAVFPESVPVPMFVVPSKKVTEPVGVPDAVETVAVKVILCPAIDGFKDEVIVVVVAAFNNFNIQASKPPLLVIPVNVPELLEPAVPTII